MLLLNIVLASFLINTGPGLSVCPTWFHHPNSQSSDCICGNRLNGAIRCDTSNNSVQLAKRFCILFDDELNTTLTVTCPYSNGGRVPRNVSQLNDYDGLCKKYNRRGQLCGACKENYTLPVYSYYFGCVECEDYKYGWLKFITAAFLPLTIFYILVIIFRISGTSQTLNGFVLVSQIIATPSVLRETYSHNPYYHAGITRVCTNIGIAVYAIWNLDFFRSFYKPICLHPDLKYQHVLLLDYAVAVYPLLLIFITFICVKLHDNFAIVVWLWRPFHKCLVRFRKRWNIQSYLVNALATFIVLSYVKILNVSFQFLISSSVYNIEGHLVSKAYWYYDGRVDMTSREYVPYLVLALFMLLIFNIFPLVLLTLYPFRCFQVFLNCCPYLRCKLALHLFLDTFYGCYKDNEHDYRLFAALYLAVRFFNLLLSATIRNHTACAPATILLFVFVLTLVAKFQPYKCKKSNTVDILLLLTLITGLVFQISYHAVGLRQMCSVVFLIIICIPPGYILFLALACITTKVLQCFHRSKAFLLERMNQIKEDGDTEESALLNQGASGYSTFPNSTY